MSRGFFVDLLLCVEKTQYIFRKKNQMMTEGIKTGLDGIEEIDPAWTSSLGYIQTESML